MISCERCGKEMPDNAAICPSCGTISSLMRPGTTPPTEYGQGNAGQSSFGGTNYPPEYGRGYMPQMQQSYQPQPSQSFPPQQQYMAPQQQSYGYAPPQQPYATPYQAVNVNVNMNSASSNSSTAVLVEVLLSLFLGIYGVGWFMAGESTVGIILLICSFVVYWPLVILGTIFTLGLGLICIGPLAIVAIIVNAIMLNNALKNKATQVTIMQR